MTYRAHPLGDTTLRRRIPFWRRKRILPGLPPLPDVDFVEAAAALFLLGLVAAEIYMLCVVLSWALHAS